MPAVNVIIFEIIFQQLHVDVDVRVNVLISCKMIIVLFKTLASTLKADDRCTHKFSWMTKED